MYLVPCIAVDMALRNGPGGPVLPAATVHQDQLHRLLPLRDVDRLRAATARDQETGSAFHVRMIW